MQVICWMENSSSIKFLEMNIYIDESLRMRCVSASMEYSSWWPLEQQYCTSVWECVGAGINRWEEEPWSVVLTHLVQRLNQVKCRSVWRLHVNELIPPPWTLYGHLTLHNRPVLSIGYHAIYKQFSYISDKWKREIRPLYPICGIDRSVEADIPDKQVHYNWYPL